MGRKEEEIWIGMAEVREVGADDLLQGALGAFVVTLARATGPEDFIQKATHRLNLFGFEVVEFEDIETLEACAASSDVPEETLRLVDRLDEAEGVVFGSFHAYAAMEDDDDTID